jgi:hypothetical protein
MSRANAAPESLELRELRALRGDVAALARVVDRLAANTDLIREAVLGLGGRVAALEQARDRGLLTPLPSLSDSWVPDHGDNGR